MRSLRLLVFSGLLLIVCGYIRPAFDRQDDQVRFKERIVAKGLRDPWNIVLAPDGSIWVNEAKGYQVSRIDAKTGSRTVLLDLNAEREFAVKKDEKTPWPQGGLMGMALHPQFREGKPFVYLAYAYKHVAGNRFMVRLARYRYNAKAGKLDNAAAICDTIPASNDHNGGRLAIANVNGKPFLFYAVGDMGSGQFSNGGVKNRAQDKSSYEGKILRYALEPVLYESGGKTWVPADNPFGERHASAVWSVGHRNPQGLTAGKINGVDFLYASEHGPYSDDEVNIIVRGGNYGHPLVIGYADGNYDGLAASVSSNADYPGKWHTSYPFIRSEQHNADSIGKVFKEPIRSFHPTDPAALNTLFNNILNDKKGTWESAAPAGIAFYGHDAIPGWKNSLLIASLKGGALLRLTVGDGRDARTVPVFSYQEGNRRYRDVAVSPKGDRIYLATDSATVTSGPSAENPESNTCRGCIIELTYQPER